ncbi:MAG: Flp pilus assembly complex ATPase component TadA [Candidatus Zambryskibacteria bacterium]|nr:Flp pilus assembly complex ATPase component TadA [Candidatus Zambryskibacteria bacterium]
MVIFDEEKQKERLRALRGREEEELAQTLAAHHGIPYLDLSVHPINIDALRVLKEDAARDAEMAVFNATDKNIDVAVLSPKNDKAKAVIEELKQKGYVPEIYMVSHASLKKVWDRYKDLSYSFETQTGALDISNEEILEMTKKVATLPDIKKMIEEVLELKRTYRISRILEIILAGALSLKASDVHFEPEEEKIRLRYRLDGVLTDVLFFDKETYELLLSRVKLISELKLNIKERAQDGRFSIKLAETEIEVRTSLLPGPYGESVVLRVLNPETIGVEFEKLGIHPRLLDILNKEVRKPNGMILTTGPTGSGKTTTLYAFLKKIYTPEIKVVTIENPIEYHLEGIVQTQTDSALGYTFAEGLRSALRQDPDVIMVGEIRDGETAAVAVNAALTGHLVLSTLHTNNAAGSFPRLLDLGVNPKVVSSALNVSIAQRLVRVLCGECRKEKILEGKDKEVIERVLSGVGDTSYLEGVQKEKVWAPAGCPKCGFLGYKGRIGVFEVILIDSDIEKAVIENPSERDIRAAAEKQKLLTLAQDGVLKVLNGVTSLEELQRVVNIE